MTEPKIIVALDYPDAASALLLAHKLDPTECRLKVGKELFTSSGPQLIEALNKLNFSVFLDLKFHDIPNTVAKACQAASNLGVWMLNVHASGGIPMMQAACEGVDKANNHPILIAVTVLTSMDQSTLNQVGINTSVQDHVLKLATMSQQAGLAGVVCSAQEAPILKQALGAEFCLVTPGVRPTDANLDDQSRVVTPRQAVALGAHYLVIGRPITQAHDPRIALEKIIQDLSNQDISN